MTLVVLGLDALDAALVEYFDCEHLQLETHGELASVAHNRTYPFTLQVWPTIATGLHPTEHGNDTGGESQWDNPVVDVASSLLAPHLSTTTRATLGSVIERLTGSAWSIGEIDADTVFDGPDRYVHNWPGVCESHWIERIWREIDYTVDAGLPQEDFDRRIWGLAAQQFGWVAEMLRHDAALVASHVHVLDPAGHAYATNEAHYRAFYEEVDRRVGTIRDRMGEGDDLLVLSDHGIQVEWLGDDDVSEHSWRAFSASTLDTRPEDVHDVRSWIEAELPRHEREFDRTDLDLPEETLRDLGYI